VDWQAGDGLLLKQCLLLKQWMNYAWLKAPGECCVLSVRGMVQAVPVEGKGRSLLPANRQ